MDKICQCSCHQSNTLDFIGCIGCCKYAGHKYFNEDGSLDYKKYNQITNQDGLLTRDNFRESVFKRDNHQCVICHEPAQDAHHIMERRLFENGGYYLDNGASLCGKCHLKAESTELSCTEIRNACGIQKIVLPEHLYRDNEYDKWGNIILTNKQRVKGELFSDESVQKIIKPYLNLFTDYVKYPRTYHLPFSASRTNDDRTLSDCSQFFNKEVVITEKLDGENSSIYNGYFHARSLENDSHPSRAWIKNFASNISWEIPQGWRICGENLYAKHSIGYDNLESYFYMFSIWNENNYCLSWDETIEYGEILGIQHVPVIWRGIFDENLVRSLPEKLDLEKVEGFVVRCVDGFPYGAFRKNLAKYVRKGHVAETAHNWKMQMVVPNKLKERIDVVGT